MPQAEVILVELQLFSSNPDNLTAVNKTLYFVAEDCEHGRELWKYGGDFSWNLFLPAIIKNDD